MALQVVTEAMAEGRLRLGGIITEGTAGSTGVSLAMVRVPRGGGRVGCDTCCGTGHVSRLWGLITEGTARALATTRQMAMVGAVVSRGRVGVRVWVSDTCRLVRVSCGWHGGQHWRQSGQGGTARTGTWYERKLT